MAEVFELGKYTVRAGLRPDNPLFPVYIIFKGKRLIGRQFSVPSLTDCEWLERTGGTFEEPTGFQLSEAERERRRRCGDAGRKATIRTNKARKALEAA